MATAAGIIGGAGSSSTSLFRTKKTSSSRRKNSSSSRMFCVASYSVKDPYQTLRIQPGASESEVKKAFRQLALQYHPDVCRGSNCGVQFSQINEAYDIALRNLREEAASETYGSPSDEDDEPLATAEDMWEEWMGWEGAGIRDYSSHINPYI